MDSGVALNLVRTGINMKTFRPIRNDNKMVRLITNRAKMDPKKIIFAEADHLDAKSSQIVLEEGIGQPILLGNMEIIVELKERIRF
jgi:malate dehydrogenase (oxaloacetate-decarboxylating)(NADP+)